MKKHNMIIPFLIFLLVSPFFIMSIYISKNTIDYGFFSTRQINSILNTFLFGIITGLLATFSGNFLAIMSLKYIKKINYLLLALLIYMLFPPYIHNIAWNKFIQLASHNVILTGIFISTIVQSIYFLPFATIIWILFYQNIPRDYFDEIRLNKGENNSILVITTEFGKYVTLILFFIVFLLSINDFTIPSIFAFNTYPVEIMSLFSSNFSLGKTLVASLPLFITSLLITFILLISLYKNPPTQIPNTKYNYFIKHSTTLSIFWCLFLFLPLGFMAIDIKKISFFRLFHMFKDDFIFSFYIAIISSILTIFISYIFSFYASLNKWYRFYILSVLLILFALPPTINGIIINKFYQTLSIYLPIFNSYSSLPTIHVLVNKTLPISFLILYIGMMQIDNNKIYLFSLDSSNSITYLIHSTLQDMKKFLSIAFMFSFIMSILELGGTLMVLPPGKSTITITIYNYLHYGNSSTVSILCLIYIGIILLVSFTTYKIYRYL